ncbi:MAG: hypothetical protein ACT4PZ_09795 [Panacagrimonas sp.]
MNFGFNKSSLAVAIATTFSGLAMSLAPSSVSAAGTYIAGDIHNHTTCSDGSISMQKLVKKSIDKKDTPWGLDWFVQAGHGGSGNRNCTLAEDATLATPAYPLVFALDGTTIQGPSTSWQNTNPPITPKGRVQGSSPNQVMWRWQSMQEFQYPLLEHLSAASGKPLFLGLESVVAGHEHTSMAVITGQMPAPIFRRAQPTSPGYSPLGNATALSFWSYCFDRGDTDTSRGNTTVGSAVGNNWDCSVPGSPNAADASWNATAQKLVPASGSGTGNRGHAKTVEAMKWMAAFHPDGSYYIPTHLERAGPFNPNGNNGFNVEHLRNFNNAAPKVAFGMETQPGHGASDARGEYTIRRNNFGTGVGNVDSVGGTTYGGTGVYGAQIGGVWDALLGEGRNYWFFASSDWHNRGSFGPDDRRSSQDFYPGEYQRNYTNVVDTTPGGLLKTGLFAKNSPVTPQEIVDGLRTGNTYTDSGQLIDRLAFIACASYGPSRPTPLRDFLSNAAVESMAAAAATKHTSVENPRCATMGEKLVVRPGADVVVSIVLRDPSGTNYSPYSFPNPSLAQVGISQPLNAPVLDHVDVIAGLVTGYRTPGTPGYAGEWPRDWINAYLSGGTPSLATVPDAAKNTSAAVVRTFNSATWKSLLGVGQFKSMTFRIPAVGASGYLRLRGSNLPASVPFETDASGNPLPDVWTNAGAVSPTVSGGSNGIAENANLRIPCTTVGTTDFDGCPAHMGTIAGQKYSSYDVAAWSDLWFYSNPIYIEVAGGTVVAGVQ